MTERSDPSEHAAASKAQQEDFGHPVGTLIIVAIFGALFGLGWLAMYVWKFLEQGAPHS